ncbi:hypothetical protein BJF90_37600 [Pseudonocardia sp. CNS-004]|nr:hypothetical protein BJF90_37600 [Pseudonocardia sp. CNS-004]
MLPLAVAQQRHAAFGRLAVELGMSWNAMIVPTGAVSPPAGRSTPSPTDHDRVIVPTGVTAPSRRRET